MNLHPENSQNSKNSISDKIKKFAKFQKFSKFEFRRSITPYAALPHRHNAEYLSAFPGRNNARSPAPYA